MVTPEAPVSAVNAAQTARVTMPRPPGIQPSRARGKAHQAGGGAGSGHEFPCKSEQRDGHEHGRIHEAVDFHGHQGGVQAVAHESENGDGRDEREERRAEQGKERENDLGQHEEPSWVDAAAQACCIAPTR